MAERRSAAAALNLDAKVHEFIAAGMPAATEVKEPEARKGAIKKTSPANVESSSVPKSPPAATEPKPKRIPPAETESPAYARTIARARIQKSVRFLPQLIARFEDHCRNEELDGKKPISIQDALNEALEIWLKENSKSK